jgi:hypothetical protein
VLIDINAESRSLLSAFGKPNIIGPDDKRPSDNLGRFNIIGLAAEPAEIRIQEAGITVKIWHVAALALTGWCLMMPPFVQGKHGVVDGDAPLLKWTVTNAFDTAAECENFRGTSLIFDQKRAAQDPTNQSYKVLRAQRALSKCIAGDDPRLVYDPVRKSENPRLKP